MRPDVRSTVLRIVACILLAVLLAACAAPISPGAPESVEPAAADVTSNGEVTSDGSIVVAMGVQSFEGLDPHMQASPPTNAIVRTIYDTLVIADANNQIHPMLADSWEAVDDTTYVFHLHPGVTFHDGTPLDATAVVASFERLLNPDNALTRRGQYEFISSVEALDDSTVQFNLAYPTGTLLNQLAYVGGAIMSPTAIETYGADLATHPVGAGPFTFADATGGEFVTVERFDDYWKGPHALSEITFRPVTEDATRVIMLQTGEADIITNLPAASLDQIEADSSLQSVVAESNRVIHIGMNTTKPPLDNVLVRQALNYAVDKEAIVNGVLRGLGKVSDSYIADSTWGYVASGGYSYDPERARELLAEANLPDGFETTLWVPAGRYFMGQETAEAVQAYLAQVGVKATIESIEWGAFTEDILHPLDDGNESQLYLLGWEASTGEPSGVSRWAFMTSSFPPAGWNTMFYSNPELDGILEQAEITVDDATRADLYAQAQQIVVEEAPWLFLHSLRSVWGANAALDNIVIQPDETLILNDVTLK